MALLFTAQLPQVDASGDPYSGAKLYFYQTGTTTSITTYQDSAAGTPHANPVVANSKGEFAPIYVDTATFKVVLKDSSDVTVRTIDPVNITADEMFGIDGEIKDDELILVDPADSTKQVRIDAGNVTGGETWPLFAGKGANVASAGTVTLGAGNFFHITGTTTITDIDFTDAYDGRWAILEFDGALTLTHNATTLVLPGGGNITTAAGDTSMVVQDSSDNVHVVWYQRAATGVGSGTSTDDAIARYDGTTGTLQNSGVTIDDSNRVTLENTDAGASNGPDLVLYRNSASPATNDLIGRVRFDGEDSAGNQKVYARVQASIDDPTSGSEDGVLSVYISRAGTVEHSAKFDSGGRLLIGDDDYTGLDVTDVGISLQGSGGGAPGNISATTASSEIIGVNRQSDDGNLIDFYQAGSFEGAISVSGNTVSYGAFCGVHWTQPHGNERIDILPGTVCETIDEMCSWPEEGPEKRLAKFKVSDTPASKSVYGVFMNWHEDDADENPADANVAALGAYMIRIAPGETIERGILLESNGDGCARVQADDIMRAGTIAKVTGAVVVETYPDGSYLVPCTLHCG